MANDSFECLGFVFGEGGEDLAIEDDTFLLERIDELAVGDAERAGSGVDADVPKRSEVALLVLAVVEGVLTCVHVGFPSDALFLGAAMAITLRLLEQRLSEL